MRALALLLLLLLLLAAPAPAREPSIVVYEHSCAWCHGKDGRGDGPAAFTINKYRSPRPRDLTRGHYKFRSTESGQLPTDDDLMRTLERGVPGYMPSFRGLTAGERRLAIKAVKSFYPGFATATPTAITIPEPPPADAAAVERGRAAYAAAGCPSCHGDRGRGNGPSASALKDEMGLPITPADLRHPQRFKNGAEPGDVYRTLVTGLDGTPMPSYATAFDEPNAIWDLVAFIRSLQ